MSINLRQGKDRDEFGAQSYGCTRHSLLDGTALALRGTHPPELSSLQVKKKKKTTKRLSLLSFCAELDGGKDENG